MATDLITLRRDILASGERALTKIMDTSNDRLPGIAAMRARYQAGVDHARAKLADAVNGSYQAAV